ncbi:MAG: DUF6438 domain-containing protein [Gemmatimonadaceae bacterium]|nr:DUF6438 domain-containing protein [Gemmatimonadaceae bacterium]
MTRPFEASPAMSLRAAAALGALALAGCAANGAVPDSSAATPSAAPAYTRVTLERKPCFGTCPVYRVSVAENGAVIFEGLGYVDSIGSFTGRIDAERVAALARLFEEHDYFALDDKYAYGEPNCAQYGTDAPTVITSITIGDRSKRVEHDLGCAGVPQRLWDLESGIDEIIGTSRWIGR